MRPPRPNTKTMPSAKSIGDGQPDRALPDRVQPVQEQELGRHADDQRQHHERLAEQRVHAGHEHVVAVDDRREHGDRDHRADRAPVPIGRLAREEREEVADDAPGRQDEDVDLWVAEDPEEVLEENRIAAAARPPMTRR